MAQINKNTILLLSFFCISFIFSSCTVQNRLYRPGYSFIRNDDKNIIEISANNNITNSFGREYLLSNKEPETVVNKYSKPVENSTCIVSETTVSKKQLKNFHEIVTPATSGIPAAYEADSDSCDLIILRNGVEIFALVRELTPTEVKYKRCDMPGGPLITVNRSDVFLIKYANGAKEVFQQTDPVITSDQPTVKRKTHAGGVIAFISSLIGLIVFGIPLGLLAIILGTISVSKINSKPNLFKGSAFGIIGIIIGAVDIIGVIIILSGM